MWSLFGDSKPRATNEEYKRVRGYLYSEGFSQQELAEVDMLFLGDFEKGSSHQRGIDATELKEKIVWLRANPSKHHLEPNKIDKIEEALRKKI